jgi:hypothetical protein
MPLVPPQYIIIGAAKVQKAKDGFNKLINEMAGENLIAQITAAGKTKIISDAVKDVLVYGNSGSLWEAYIAVEKIAITPEMAPYLTEVRKQEFKNKIIELISSL